MFIESWYSMQPILNIYTLKYALDVDRVIKEREVLNKVVEFSVMLIICDRIEQDICSNFMQSPLQHGCGIKSEHE